LTVTESRRTRLIRIRLEFLKPFGGHQHAEFAFKPEAIKPS